jgi:UDP-N-acetylmuramyl pentapeptide phosphotransferase/UDP-N-acetylglucosamine-1-phosphate transferase
MPANFEIWWLWAPAVVAATAAVTATLVVLLYPALQRYASARPNARSSHTLPTPQGGGIAVLVGIVTVSLAAVPAMPGAPALSWLWPVFGPAALLAAVGAFDDVRDLAAGPRLLLQMVAVGIAIMMLPAELRLLPSLPLAIERVLLVLGGVWFVNLVNFMDGLDWMTVAEFVPLSAGLAVLGFFGALQPVETVIALALCGGMLGFAPFNRPVARLFLGDVGSLPIGLLSGWLLLLLAMRGHWAAALLLPLYYLADATLTLLRRLLAGERVWEAHRTHFYQRATVNGLSVREVIARVLVVNAALAVLAVCTVLTSSALISGIALGLGGLLTGWLLRDFSRKRS